MSDEKLTSRRPYLIRAMREWMLDNSQTPHVVVDASLPGVEVPGDHVRDGRIVLNISDAAVKDLILGNEIIACEARFGGRPFHISVPVAAVLGIYARESGQGMIFSGDGDATPPDGQGSSEEKRTGNRPHLKVVK